MLTVLPSFVPIWALAAVGFLARRTGVLDARAGQALTAFVFSFAAPALVFSTLATSSPRGVFQPAVAGFVVTGVITLLAGGVLSWLWWRRRGGEQVLIGMAGGYVNAGNLGIPVAVQVLGNTEFIIAVILLQTVLLTPLCLLLVEYFSGRAGRRLLPLLSAPFRNPIVLGSLAGLVVLLTGLQLPDVVLRPVEMLGRAAVPAGLFVLGMALYRGAGSADETSRPWEIVTVTVMKLLVQPAIAVVVGTALGVSGPALLALVLCSGLPTAQNVFVYSHHFRMVSSFVRDTVFATTLLSMGTLACITWLFGP